MTGIASGQVPIEKGRVLFWRWNHIRKVSNVPTESSKRSSEKPYGGKMLVEKECVSAGF